IGEAQADFARATEVDGVCVEDDRVLAEVLKTLPSGVAVQGNLSPQSLLAGGDVMRAEVASLLRSLPKDRHIFNLGHGIVPQTPIAHVAEVVAMIRAAD
ncbi:MAG TPA: uroporphyrinogen decarboxylase family protein, partial [Aestuariivirga sp.]|nr:uroporphyrinogen decarboxylase family protein [Aestuariivirga sp.]